MVTTSLGTRIRAARKAFGISADRLAELCDSSRSTIYSWEGDVYEPSITELKRIATALRVDIVKLISGEIEDELQEVGPETVQIAGFSSDEIELLKVFVTSLKKHESEITTALKESVPLRDAHRRMQERAVVTKEPVSASDEPASSRLFQEY